MTRLQSTIKAARRRLWLNRWIGYFSFVLLFVSGACVVTVFLQRAFDVGPSFGLVAVLAGVVSLGVPLVLTILRRDSLTAAAVVLDERAGLKERLSSGHLCADVSDPFAQAVVADAERISGALSPRQHIRLVSPRSAPWTLGSAVLLAAMFLLPRGFLKRNEVDAATSAEGLAETQVVVQRQLDAVKQLVENSPALNELRDEAAKLDKDLGVRLEKPTDIRHEAVKKIDMLADAIRKQRQDESFEAVRSVRKALRNLKVPDSIDSPAQKLVSALQKGDFKTAKEEVNALKEQLATLKSEQDKEMAAKLGEQLDQLSKQLEQLASDQRLAEKLEQAGVKKEDAKRLAESLKKKDLEQIKQELSKQGLSEQQVQNLAKQVQQQQQAGSVAQKLAQQMQQGAQCNSPGQMGEAMAGMTAAAEQLGELEQMQQQMAEMDSALADLAGARQNIDKPCSSCQGKGCGQCAGDKQVGMGKEPGKGSGGIAPEEQASHGFKIERGKVHTGKGAIVGQFQVEGDQIKGEVTPELIEVVTAAEREASDQVRRDRIPRQYHDAVKGYFSNTGGMFGGGKDKAKPKEEPAGTEEKQGSSSKEAKPADGN